MMRINILLLFPSIFTKLASKSVHKDPRNIPTVTKLSSDIVSNVIAINRHVIASAYITIVFYALRVPLPFPVRTFAVSMPLLPSHSTHFNYTTESDSTPSSSYQFFTYCTTILPTSIPYYSIISNLIIRAFIHCLKHDDSQHTTRSNRQRPVVSPYIRHECDRYVMCNKSTFSKTIFCLYVCLNEIEW